jgi:hypothetical protein
MDSLPSVKRTAAMIGLHKLRQRYARRRANSAESVRGGCRARAGDITWYHRRDIAAGCAMFYVERAGGHGRTSWRSFFADSMTHGDVPRMAAPATARTLWAR